jgi:hypothetical protein
VASIWEQGRGINGASEPDRVYHRFVQYLHLGSERNLSALAKMLGITVSACSQQAKRYSWQERAAAFDAARLKGRAEYPPLEPPSAPWPVPPSAPRHNNGKVAPTGPTPPKLAKSIIPEVLPERNPEAISLVGDHVEVLARYQKHYEELGRLMAEESVAVFPLIRSFREDIEAARAAWRRLVDQKEVQLAQILCNQLLQLVPLYCRLSEAMHGHANGGRQHWGDAIGVQATLEQAYGSPRDAKR